MILVDIGVQDSSNYVCDLVKPVLTCFFDSDSRVRYYACESLYNIVKVARGSVLVFFNDVFDGLSKVRAKCLFALLWVDCSVLWLAQHGEQLEWWSNEKLGTLLSLRFDNVIVPSHVRYACEKWIPPADVIRLLWFCDFSRYVCQSLWHRILYM